MKFYISSFLYLLLLLICTLSTLEAQTTISASCGNCNEPVSANSKVGDQCPHCRVIWGKEHTSEKTNYASSRKPKSLQEIINERAAARVSSNYGGTTPKFASQELGSNLDYDNSDFMYEESNTIKNSNLRSSPSLDSEILGVIPKNASIRITKKLNDWVKISYMGNMIGETRYYTYTGWLHRSNVVF
jgi:hypothetical protein